eukprot:196626_1
MASHWIEPQQYHTNWMCTNINKIVWQQILENHSTYGAKYQNDNRIVYEPLGPRRNLGSNSIHGRICSGNFSVQASSVALWQTSGFMEARYPNTQIYCTWL